MCIKDMISDLSEMRLERSLTARIGISRQGEAYKSYSVHRCCSTPLWKIALWLLGITAGLMTVCCIRKKYRCNKVNIEE